MELHNLLQDIAVAENNFEEFHDQVERVPRIYRERSNPFDELSENQFKKRYRLSKETTRFGINLVTPRLQSVYNRGIDLTPEIQVLVALRFFAKGSYQIELGDLHGVSQSSVSRIINRVSTAIASKLPQFVKWPENINHLKRKFFDLRHFPGIVGCIDCSHIKIKNPDGQNPRLFWGRKGFYSLNVQVVCGPDTKIFDIVTRWRGSAHDSRIFLNSRIRDDFENNRRQGILLGDSGYACTRYMLTPLLNPRTAPEVAYNRAHKGTRVQIECTFGKWKNMFKALRRGIEIKLSRAKIAISAMAVLYNIRLARDNDFEIDSEDSSSSSEDEEEPIRRPDNVAGNIFRRQFIDRYFNQR